MNHTTRVVVYSNNFLNKTTKSIRVTYIYSFDSDKRKKFARRNYIFSSFSSIFMLLEFATITNHNDHIVGVACNSTVSFGSCAYCETQRVVQISLIGVGELGSTSKRRS